MSKQGKQTIQLTECNHSTLCLLPSDNAVGIGYRRPTFQQRKNAAALSNRRVTDTRTEKDSYYEDMTSFPAPLVLPDDLLADDPRSPAQSLRSWNRDQDRNEVTRKRGIVYVSAPPEVGEGAQFMQDWATPVRPKTGSGAKNISPPLSEEVLEYLKAFYHGVPVKLLSQPELCFTKWETDSSERKKSRDKSIKTSYVGLNISTECVGIRSRPSPDGVFKRQLNLNDLLDAAEGMLPEDAYALMMLVEHDIYETEDDTFACGRAYGGSRIAVVSTARYDPNLDKFGNVEREHTWPASHCKAYIDSCIQLEQAHVRPAKRIKSSSVDVNETSLDNGTIRSSVDTLIPSEDVSPLQAALTAHNSLPSIDVFPSTAQLAGIWLGRVCRTAAHELGHCFGLDHCVYYACSMQGTCSMMEDYRQPPYLCPVDLAKLLQATGVTPENRYLKLLAFCEERSDVHIFAAFGAWIRARLRIICGRQN